MKEYMIIRAYADHSCMTEHGTDLCSILSACAIYLADPDCIFLYVVDVQTDKVIVDVSR